MSPGRSFLFSAFSFLAAVLACLAPGPAGAAHLAAGLQDALVLADADELIPVVVLMREYPDPDGLLETVRPLRKEARRRHVVSVLTDLADRSQQQVRAVLSRAGQEVRDVRVLWGVNGLAFEAAPTVIEQLAEIPEVLEILHDRATGHPDGSTGGDASGPNPDAEVAGEVVAMGARRVWDELGYTGAGVIVAVIDAGIDVTHPDIADHIWTNPGEIPGNGLDDDGNGYVDDTRGWDFCTHALPAADTHGTQVAGQLAGDGTNGMVTGMAPDAEIMGLGIDCDTPSRAWQASDYAIAHGAQIISQSYSWWWTDQPDYEAFRRQGDAELAAGVIRATSAGNHGGNSSYPVPYNISTPANLPPPWIHPDQSLVGGVSSTLAVGNIVWPDDTIDLSSSTGPSAWEDIQANTDPDFPHEIAPEHQDYPYENGASMGLIKPDISAYGTGTRSICPGAIYCYFSGTSSATPHVSGTLALMLQAYPEATPERLAEALLTTAEPRGDPGKNNLYGVGLLQAFEAVTALDSGLYYDSHAIDDTAAGNGDLGLDPGESVTMSITLRNWGDTPIENVEAILSSATPGVSVHNTFASFGTVPAGGTATSAAPHFTLSVAPEACDRIFAFDLELRHDGQVRRSSFHVRVGDATAVTLLEDDFESDLGWISDPGSATSGAWVREDPVGAGAGTQTAPEDDTSDPGVTCWVTGNGEAGGSTDPNLHDVDGGRVVLISPPFDSSHAHSLVLTYDRWYYDLSDGNSFRAELSDDGGLSWTLVEEQTGGFGNWTSQSIDLFDALPSTDDMRLRFVVEDDGADNVVEGAVDEVRIRGVLADCDWYTPPAVLPPNAVGETLRLDVDPGGHGVLHWTAPPVDADHDGATLYRVATAATPDGTLEAAGTALATTWVDVDALTAAGPRFYRVSAENGGGTE